MKLYMHQKVFSWKDQFTVKDDSGADRFFIQSEFFSWGKQLHVSDTSGKEVAFIQEKVVSFKPKFFVCVDGKEIAEIIKQFSLLRPKYTIEGLDWEVNGRFMAHNYDITQGDRPIVSIHKKWMAWGDSYEIDIADEKDEILALSVVLAIDCVLADEASSSSGAGAGI